MTDLKTIIDQSWLQGEDIDNASLPLVTLGVLSYNRINDLRATLDVLTLGVAYPHKEIIVLDNNSTDGSQEMVRTEFPSVTLVAMPENIGEVARNYFLKHSKGKYIFSFDDDSYPAAPFTILNAVLYLEKNPEVVTLCFQCFQPRSNFRESAFFENYAFFERTPGIYEGVYFIEGAMGYRMSVASGLKGFDEDYFFGALGLDIALEIYQKGLRGVYCIDLLCLHMRSPTNRHSGRGYYINTRNFLWTIFKHFPLWSIPILVSLSIARRLLTCLKRPALTKFFLKGFVEALATYFPQRKKSEKLTWRQILRLKRWLIYLYRW
jgi:GT2 family glycosyltransferase